MYIDQWLFVILVVCGLIVAVEIIAFCVWMIMNKCQMKNGSKKKDLEYQKRLQELKDNDDKNKCKGIIDDLMETRPSIKSVPSITGGHRYSNQSPGEIRRDRRPTGNELEIEIKRNNSSNLSAEFFQEGEQPSYPEPDPGQDSQEIHETPSIPEPEPDSDAPKKYDV